LFYVFDLFNKLTEDYPDLKKWLTQKRFKSWLVRFADFEGFKYTEGNSNGQRWFQISDGSEIDSFENDEDPF